MKNRTRLCAINLRGFSLVQHPILKFWGQGDTHRVKMNLKPAARLLTQELLNGKLPVRQMTCHPLSNIEVCANPSGNISKHQPARKRLKKSTLAASTLACCVSTCTNHEQTRNTRPISQFTMAGTLQVAKLWHAGFHMYKPQANLVQTSNLWPDYASRCDSVLKKSSINFFFARGNCRFLRCLELKFDWGLYI